MFFREADVASSINTMNQLMADIKNNKFEKCYLFCGKEAYLRMFYKNALLKALVPEDDTMNFNKYQGNDVNVGEIIDQAETMPFLAERRIILIENSGFCKSGNDQLAEYLPTIPETTILIMVETEVDAKKKLYKAFNNVGKVYEFDVQQERDLRVWIENRMKSEKKTINRDAFDLFLERTGSDMMTIDSELAKLFSYTIDRSFITVSDVEEITTASVTSGIFDMISAMADRKTAEAIELYNDLLSRKLTTSFGALTLIVRQFNQILMVKELRAKGYPSSKVAEIMKIPSFVEGKIEKQARGFTIERLKQALDACIKVEEDVKIKSMNPDFQVELLIMEYSG